MEESDAFVFQSARVSSSFYLAIPKKRALFFGLFETKKEKSTEINFLSVFCRETQWRFLEIFFCVSLLYVMMCRFYVRVLLCCERERGGGRGTGERHSFYINIAHLTRLFVSISLSLLLYSYT